MNPIEQYYIDQGTTFGEIRYEVFKKYGETAYLTAHYGWHNCEIVDNKRKAYHLVNSNPVQFLVATETYTLIDIRPILNLETGERLDVPPIMIPDVMNPIHLHLEWFDANIPFLPKDVIDAQGISYTLP